ncbi:MAG: hypothetical protein OXC28_05565, partial [Defluviicoccus sp.]|nr:hypothetical protein [Defluviicoccus sp.]
DAGIHRPRERQSRRQAARRGSLSGPGPTRRIPQRTPGSYTTGWDTIKRVRLIVSLTQKDYEAIPSDLKEGILFVISGDQPPDQGGGSPNPDSQEENKLDGAEPSGTKGE